MISVVHVEAELCSVFAFIILPQAFDCIIEGLFHTAAFKKQYIGYCFLHLHIGLLSGSLQDIFVLSAVVLGSSSQRSVSF